MNRTGPDDSGSAGHGAGASGGWFGGADALQIPGEAEQRKLAELRDRFAGHQIVREVRDQNAGVRYCAYGVTIVIHPHTIITSSLAELETELEAAEGTGQPS